NIILVIILFSTVRSFAQTPDFAGKWKINVQKSDFGSIHPFVIFDHGTITQTQDSIYLTVVGADANGNAIHSAPVKYALNGSPSERLIQDTIKVVGTCEYTADKKAMIKKSSYSSANNPHNVLKTIIETWSLSGNGKELSVKRDLKSFDKKEISYTIVAVYDKQ
ncbi:MAG: hypothetical protein JST32_21940, partial [Bacteroidetes bacterium]|nr:hypothetical protein [Bacteroidota bacterium]